MNSIPSWFDGLVEYNWHVPRSWDRPVCMFDKVFASFLLLTCKNLHKEICTSHNLEVDTYCDL